MVEPTVFTSRFQRPAAAILSVSSISGSPLGRSATLAEGSILLFQKIILTCVIGSPVNKSRQSDSYAKQGSGLTAKGLWGLSFLWGHDKHHKFDIQMAEVRMAKVTF